MERDLGDSSFNKAVEKKGNATLIIPTRLLYDTMCPTGWVGSVVTLWEGGGGGSRQVMR